MKHYYGIYFRIGYERVHPFILSKPGNKILCQKTVIFVRFHKCGRREKSSHKTGNEKESSILRNQRNYVVIMVKSTAGGDSIYWRTVYMMWVFEKIW